MTESKGESGIISYLKWKIRNELINKHYKWPQCCAVVSLLNVRQLKSLQWSSISLAIIDKYGQHYKRDNHVEEAAQQHQEEQHEHSDGDAGGV